MFTQEDPKNLIDSAWRRLHSGRQLLSMFTDIVAWSCFIVGGFWGTFMATWAPTDRHVEMIATSAEYFALAACLWMISARSYPNPWYTEPKE